MREPTLELPFVCVMSPVSVFAIFRINIKIAAEATPYTVPTCEANDKRLEVVAGKFGSPIYCFLLSEAALPSALYSWRHLELRTVRWREGGIDSPISGLD